MIIRFLDGGGADITEASQRKIERLFSREDFRRVRPADIGDIDLVPRALERYAVALEQSIDTGAISEKGFRVVIDYGYGSASLAMPNVLAKLGLEVLAVNPYVSTAGMLGFDREQHSRDTARLVTAADADLGAVIDPTGDQLTLIDGEGNVLGDTEALFCFLELVCGSMDGDTVALPVNAPRAAAELVERGGAKVLWTKTSAPALMAEAESPGVGFAANLEGGVILPGFMPR